MAVMLSMLGLSYGDVGIIPVPFWEIMLEALGVFLSKTSVYRAMQAAGEAVSGAKHANGSETH
jgi:hypothetical protein